MQFGRLRRKIMIRRSMAGSELWKTRRKMQRTIRVDVAETGGGKVFHEEHFLPDRRNSGRNAGRNVPWQNIGTARSPGSKKTAISFRGTNQCSTRNIWRNNSNNDTSRYRWSSQPLGLFHEEQCDDIYHLNQVVGCIHSHASHLVDIREPRSHITYHFSILLNRHNPHLISAPFFHNRFPFPPSPPRL